MPPLHPVAVEMDPVWGESGGSHCTHRGWRLAAPGAVADTKALVAYVGSHDLETNMIYTADRLADAWETEEGIEGINSFLNKGIPSWRVK